MVSGGTGGVSGVTGGVSGITGWSAGAVDGSVRSLGGQRGHWKVRGITGGSLEGSAGALEGSAGAPTLPFWELRVGGGTGGPPVRAPLPPEPIDSRRPPPAA